MTSVSPTDQLYAALLDARTRTLELVQDLTDEQLLGPRLAIVNPPLWEIGHVAFFQEYWVLRHSRSAPPIRPNGDSLYDSARVDHDTRWDLLLPRRSETLAYMDEVLGRVVGESPAALSSRTRSERYDHAYFLQLALLHEDMHDEALTYTRQTLSYTAPRISVAQDPGATARQPDGPAEVKQVPAPLGDADIPGATLMLGSREDEGFVFDNEQWAHPVEVAPFSISRTAVTNAEFLSFVSCNGYQRREFWSREGWQWRERSSAGHPLYWRPVDGGKWERRHFDQWVPLEPNHPVIHVNWFEATAFCKWASRRLPTEAEWELAACGQPSAGSTAPKRRFPWGDGQPTPDHANLDSRSMGCIDVNALPAGDSAFGVRQMIGNVWEWTADWFGPYPGFSPGPYKEYSAPWFGDHKVLRGGCWATRPRLIRAAYRNFYQPDRRDVWSGFRTCAL